MAESIKVTGAIEITLIGPNGEVKDTRKIKNIVTSTGKASMAAWLASPTQTLPFMQYIALGTGQTPVATTDVALQSELTVPGYSRSQGALSSAASSWTNLATFAPGNGTAFITEAGILSTATSGILLAHQVFTVINKTALDTLSIKWTISFS